MKKLKTKGGERRKNLDQHYQSTTQRERGFPVWEGCRRSLFGLILRREMCWLGRGEVGVYAKWGGEERGG